MTPSIWQRIAVRASHALWRVKSSVVAGVVVLSAIGAYLFLYVPAQPSAGTPAVAGGRDCADTVMAALAGSASGSEQQAYQCMDTSFQQRVSAQQFATQLQASGSSRGPITKVARVGTYDSPAGSTIVYYAVDTSSEQSLGFIAYLGQNGKVLTIE
jgi:hypothetical protein